MRLTVSNQTLVEGAPAWFADELKARYMIKNPAYLDNVRMGRWNGGTPEFIRCFQKTKTGLIVPRGETRHIIAQARTHHIEHSIIDKRRVLPEVPFTFKGRLRPFQERAVADILKRDQGTLESPTGSGKTTMSLYCIAQRRQPALVVVHTSELRDQWVNRVQTFLGIPKNQIGIIGGGDMRIGDRVTVATVQSLYKCAAEVSPSIGFLVVDEAHRAPSRCFSEAVTAFDCKFMLGLSATPFRRDGLTRLIYWHLGDLVHEVKKEDLIETGDILRAEVVWRETNFETSRDPSTEYATVLSELTQDGARNQLIVADVAQAAGNGGGTCLVLTDRKQHATALSGLISGYGIENTVLTGDISNGNRQAIVDRLNRGEIRVLISTTQLLSEGFDAKCLTTLVLCTPIKWHGRLTQCVGRILRPSPGKDQGIIFDYNDVNVGVLAASARARTRVYNGAE